MAAVADVQSAARALVTAENQEASNSAQAKQTLDNAASAVTDAQNQQTATLMKDQQAIVTAQRQLETAQTSLKSTIASNAAAASPATASDIAQQQASIVTAQVAVSTAQKAVVDTTLVAPADGTVSAVNGAVGEAVASGGTTGFITLVNLSSLQVKASVLRDRRREGAGRPDRVGLVRCAHEPDVHRQGRGDRLGVDGDQQRRHLQRHGRPRLEPRRR